LKSILGIGSAGTKVAKAFREYDTYRVYGISSEIEKNSKYFLSIPELQNPEDYENLEFKQIDKFLEKIDDELTVVVCGASLSSGILLRSLQPIHARQISIEVIYIMPDLDVTSGNASLQERLVRNVVQEYARSGVFRKVLMVSNLQLEGLAGDITVLDYYDKINAVLADMYYMLDVFKNNKPVSSTFSPVREHCRICTIGSTSLDLEKEDNLLFSLENETEILYYFGINEEKLKNEKNLFRTITTKVKNKISQNIKVSFGIYSTKYDNDYIYVEYYSPEIQKTI